MKNKLIKKGKRENPIILEHLETNMSIEYRCPFPSSNNNEFEHEGQISNSPAVDDTCNFVIMD